MEFLAHDELVALTGKKTRPAQCRALDMGGIPYLLVGNYVRVMREVVEQRLLGKLPAGETATPTGSGVGPDWDALQSSEQETSGQEKKDRPARREPVAEERVSEQEVFVLSGWSP